MINERMKQLAGIPLSEGELSTLVKQDPKKWAMKFYSDYYDKGGSKKFMPLLLAFEKAVGVGNTPEEKAWSRKAFHELKKLAS